MNGSGAVHGRYRRWLEVAVLVGLLGPTGGFGSLKPLEIKQDYWAVLQQVAAGRDAEAVAELLAFEQAAVGDQQAWRYIDKLWKAKLQVIRDLLGGHSVELLRPIIKLHHDAYLEYSGLGRRHLAQHSRTMASELAEVYASRAQSPAAAAWASQAMTSFAIYLWSPSNIGESADFFFRARELDPGNALALEGLAAAYERGGNYESAIETFVLAVHAAPEDAELRLRLALCFLRGSDENHEQALRLLQQLTGDSQPSWIRSVAYQELARQELDAKQVEAAEGLLREALGELPGDQQLSVQLAVLLDKQRRRGEAIAVLDQISNDGWEVDSPRLLYDFWEPPEQQELRQQLAENLESGRQALAASLRAGGAQ